jgi:hypothetical protein
MKSTLPPQWPYTSTHAVGDTWYRYEDSGDGCLELVKFRVVKVNPATVRIARILDHAYIYTAENYTRPEQLSTETRNVLRGKGSKRFAYPTIELAQYSYIQRKYKQIQHLSRQLRETINRFNLSTTFSVASNLSSYYSEKIDASNLTFNCLGTCFRLDPDSDFDPKRWDEY